MGSSTIPAAGGSSSSAPLYAGSLVTSGYASLGFASFSLSTAGQYVVVVNNNGSVSGGYGTGGVSNPQAAYTYDIPTGTPTYLNLANVESNLSVYNRATLGAALNFTSMSTNSPQVSALSYANGYYFASGQDNNNRNQYVYWSTDGVNYANRVFYSTVVTTNGYPVGQVYYNNAGTYWAQPYSNSVTEYAIYFTTVSGTPNTYVGSFSAPGGGTWFQAWAYGTNGYWVNVASSTNGTQIYSQNGAFNGSYIARATSLVTGTNAVSAGYGMSTFVVGYQSGAIVSSTDSITWSARTSGLSANAGANGIVGFTGTPSYIYAWAYRNGNSNYDYSYSTNGTTWTVANFPSQNAFAWGSFTYGLPPISLATNSFFVSGYDPASYFPFMFYTTNGVSWTTIARASELTGLNMATNSYPSFSVWYNVNNKPVAIYQVSNTSNPQGSSNGNSLVTIPSCYISIYTASTVSTIN